MSATSGWTPERELRADQRRAPATAVTASMTATRPAAPPGSWPPPARRMVTAIARASPRRRCDSTRTRKISASGAARHRDRPRAGGSAPRRRLVATAERPAERVEVVHVAGRVAGRRARRRRRQPAAAARRSGCAAVSVATSVIGCPASSKAKASERNCSSFCHASSVASLTRARRRPWTPVATANELSDRQRPRRRKDWRRPP